MTMKSVRRWDIQWLLSLVPIVRTLNGYKLTSIHLYKYQLPFIQIKRSKQLNRFATNERLICSVLFTNRIPLKQVPLSVAFKYFTFLSTMYTPLPVHRHLNVFTFWHTTSVQCFYVDRALPKKGKNKSFRGQNLKRKVQVHTFGYFIILQWLGYYVRKLT